MKTPILASWSWQEIQRVYAVFGQQLAEYNGVHQRINVPTAHIDNSDEENVFFMRFWGDVRRVNLQLQALDTEIARRNSLIGVMG